MLKTTMSIVTIAVLGMSGLSAEIVRDTKDIVVVATAQQNIQPAPSTQGYNDTIIYARGAKKQYAVGEEIKVQLKLKRDAYIYFWTVGASGNGYLILPNNFDSFNKYRKNTEYAVPNRSSAYSFTSDRVGVEKVYVLATDKKIDSKKIESIFNKKAGGVVPMSSHKSIKNFITKDIVVIANSQNLKYDMESFEIGVYGNPSNTQVNMQINR